MLPPQDIKILIVDDQSPMLRIIKGLLKRIGYENVEIAENGMNAWATLNILKVDFIISDWNMPVMTGIELLEKVRKTKKFKDIPFLMITSEATEDSVLKAIKSGVTSYIAKPLTLETFARKIEEIFS